MLKLKLQYPGHLMQRTDSFEKTLMLGKIEGTIFSLKDDRGWDGWMASLTQWTWVWVGSGNWWCNLTVSSSATCFSICLQSFPASWSFPMSQLSASGGQSIGASASVSVLPMNIQDWFPLGRTSWISLQSKKLSRVFSSTTVQKNQFFWTQSSLWYNSHIYTWLLEKAETLICLQRFVQSKLWFFQ